MNRKLTVVNQNWPLKKTFTISRGKKDSVDLIFLEIQENNNIGRGESVPYLRYGESVEGVIDEIESIRLEIEDGLNREELNLLQKPGAARNAIDCALWDLESKKSGVPAWKCVNNFQSVPLQIALTVSMASPLEMADEAKSYGSCDLLKIKVGSEKVIESLQEIRKVAPKTKIIVDANEAWSIEQLKSWQSELVELKISLVEQPLPAELDHLLTSFDHLVPICADESCHTKEDILRISDMYDFINIKLDKTGGLTEALKTKQEAEKYDLGIMIGCMVSTSLSMAPAILLTKDVDFIDLDGPTFLHEDRQPSILGELGIIYPALPELWG